MTRRKPVAPTLALALLFASTLSAQQPAFEKGKPLASPAQ
jgi:hypothetical protein